MKLLILALAFVSTAFATTAQFEQNVIELLNDSIYFGYIDSYSSLEFVDARPNGDEVYQLTYIRPIFGDDSASNGEVDVDEIVGTEEVCEYIQFSKADKDFYFTGITCKLAAELLALKRAESAAEISEALQTDKRFSFILDYELPPYVTTVKDVVNGDVEIFKLDYVDVKNVSFCKYITFDPETNFLELTNVNCDQPVDEVIEENLREL